MSSTTPTDDTDQRQPDAPQERFSCLPGLLLAYFILAVIAVGACSQQVPR